MRLYRALLQSETQTLDDRISGPYGVREPGGISLSGCHPNRVQASSGEGCRVRRRDFIKVIAGSAAAWPLATRAQQSERMRRIGVLMAYDESDQEGQAWVR